MGQHLETSLSLCICKGRWLLPPSEGTLVLGEPGDQGTV